MITAFIGGILNPLQDKGNGKTASMTFACFIAKYPHAKITKNKIILGKPACKVYANYNLKIADEILSVKDIIDLFFSDKLRNCVIAIDELQLLLDSHFGLKPSKKNKVSIQETLMRLVQQSRKRNIEIYYTSQSWENVHAVMRRHTNYVYEPVKKHFDNTLCIQDKCKEPHIIELYDLRFPDLPPALRFPLHLALPLYNSDEIIFYKSEDFYQEQNTNMKKT